MPSFPLSPFIKSVECMMPSVLQICSDCKVVLCIPAFSDALTNANQVIVVLQQVSVANQLFITLLNVIHLFLKYLYYNKIINETTYYNIMHIQT